MCIPHNQKYEKSGDDKIYQCGDHFTIKDSLIRKIFDMFYSEFDQDRIENHRRNEIVYHSFYQFSHFSSNKQSYCDTDDIVL